ADVCEMAGASEGGGPGTAPAGGEARGEGRAADAEPRGVARDRLRGDVAGGDAGADQHVVTAARARVRAQPLRRDDIRDRRSLPGAGLPGGADRDEPGVAAAPRAPSRAH